MEDKKYWANLEEYLNPSPEKAYKKGYKKGRDDAIQEILEMLWSNKGDSYQRIINKRVAKWLEDIIDE